MNVASDEKYILLIRYHMLHHYYMLQVTIMQKSAGSQLEEHLSLWPTNLRPAGKIRGLKWKYCDLDPEINAVDGLNTHLVR